MPIDYELEKQKFFEKYNFKVNDIICIPERGNTKWLIYGICPKFLKIQLVEKDSFKTLQWYSTSNKEEKEMYKC